MRADSPQLVNTRDQAYKAVCAAKHAGNIVGVVPTMGALHEGHLSLVRRSVAECAFTAVTIFVNPAQFGPREDLASYPTPLEADLAALRELNVDLVFVPDKDEMYPSDFSTYIDPPKISLPLEGTCRPDHFRGVATVVLKLFNILPADAAYFGEKDYQQLLVIRRIVAELNIPIKVRACPIVREPDGLALSSRNVYLSSREREQALSLSRCLKKAAELVQSGETNAELIREQMRAVLLNGGVDALDYVSLADPETLQEVTQVVGPVRALVAAHLGKTRLIDNCLIG